MKLLIISALLAVAATETIVGQPAQLVFRRNQNRALLQTNQESLPNQIQQGSSSSEGTSSSQEGFSDSQSFSSPQQGLGEVQQSFSIFNQGASDSRLEFPSSSHGFSSSGQSFLGSNPGVLSSGQNQRFIESILVPISSSQSFSSQSTQGVDSDIPSPINSQANFRNSEVDFSSSEEQFTSSQDSPSKFQQTDSSKFSQSSSATLQQQPNINQLLSGNIQQSSGSQFQQNNKQPQFNSNIQLQRSGESSSSKSQEEDNGVFEPLNLPSGATRLLGDINTSFDCINQPYGYYADEQNSCRVFHICYPALFSTGRIETYQYSFMCGENTRFDQKELSCVKESDAIPCSSSTNYYTRNSEFGLPNEQV